MTEQATPKPEGAIRLFRAFGINVYLHWTWALAAVFLIQWKQDDYSSLVWPVLEYLSIFAIVLLHEFGHALACRSVGGTADRIMLWPLGGVAFVSPPLRPWPYLWSIAAGPLVNVVLMPLFWLLVMFDATGRLTVSPDVSYFLQSLLWINLVLLVFNLLPLFPLDGGQLVRGVIWLFAGPWKSLTIASAMGIAGGVALGAVALLWLQSLWMAVLVAFLLMQCVQGFKQGRALSRLLDAPRRPGVACARCRQNPPVGTLWRCECGQDLDSFESLSCPNCGRPQHMIACPFCGQTAPREVWHAAAPYAVAPITAEGLQSDRSRG